MTTATAKARPATRRRSARRTRRTPRLSASRFYALLFWSLAMAYMLSQTVIHISGG